ncbi:unnamed protein product [Trifolium pratense]|uniref:Uncharacterized protein n=1 Tax=Trifolium pratense TaxID=57577 RepID=A0ACB0J072_TRIPR|nr:unnamed protein product [Trifolium pratense]
MKDYFEFDETSWINLAVLNRSIALFSYHEDATFHISILVEFGMKESWRTWTKLLTVGSLPCVKHPLGVGSKGEIFFIRSLFVNLNHMINSFSFTILSPPLVLRNLTAYIEKRRRELICEISEGKREIGRAKTGSDETINLV